MAVNSLPTKKVSFLFAVVCASICVSTSAKAYSVDYMVTRSGSSSAIHALELSQGKTVALSVWCKSDVPDVSGVAVLFGWSQSLTAGTGASILDNMITGSIAQNVAAGWGGPRTNNISGGKGETDSIRPYGTNTTLSSDWGYYQSVADWTRLFDVSLTNNKLISGAYTICLWDYGTLTPPSLGRECYLTSSTGEKFSPGSGYDWKYNMVVSVPVPEPGSLLICISGLIALSGGIIRQSACK